MKKSNHFRYEMFGVRRHGTRWFQEFRRTLIAERIPHYKERSALLPAGINSPFPFVVEPDIDLELLFRSHEQLQDNLQRRHWIVDVKKVEHDYQLWKKLNKQLAEAGERQISVNFFIFNIEFRGREKKFVHRYFFFLVRTSSTVGRTIVFVECSISGRLSSFTSAITRCRT